MIDERHDTGAEVAAGMGLGLLVGVLLGLSSTGVVGGVVTALAAVLAAFLGLSGTGASSKGMSVGRARIAAFGFACTLGVGLGLATRAHDWLSEPIGVQVERWRHAGASPADAIDFVAWQRLGVMPHGRTIGEVPKPSAAQTVLFANPSATQCSQLSGRRFAQPAGRLDAMSRAGGSWQRAAEAISRVQDSDHADLMDAAYELACGG